MSVVCTKCRTLNIHGIPVDVYVGMHTVNPCHSPGLGTGSPANMKNQRKMLHIFKFTDLLHLFALKPDCSPIISHVHTSTQSHSLLSFPFSLYISPFLPLPGLVGSHRIVLCRLSTTLKMETPTSSHLSVDASPLQTRMGSSVQSQLCLEAFTHSCITSH